MDRGRCNRPVAHCHGKLVQCGDHTALLIELCTESRDQSRARRRTQRRIEHIHGMTGAVIHRYPLEIPQS